MEIWIDITEVTDRLTELGIDFTPWVAGSPPATDSKLGKQILESQRRFERLTHRNFEEVTDDIVDLDGNGHDTLVLPQHPVTAVSTIEILDFNPNITTQLTGWRLGEEGRVHLTGSAPFGYSFFPEGEMNVRITYTHGYSVTPSITIPEDIQDAIVLMVILEIIERSPKEYQQEGLVSFTAGDYKESYGKGTGGLFADQKAKWNSDIQEVINRYKRILIG